MVPFLNTTLEVEESPGMVCHYSYPLDALIKLRQTKEKIIPLALLQTSLFSLYTLHVLHRYCKCLRKHCIDRDLFLVCMQLLHLAWRIVSVCLPQEPFYAFMYMYAYFTFISLNYNILFHITVQIYLQICVDMQCRHKRLRLRPVSSADWCQQPLPLCRVVAAQCNCRHSDSHNNNSVLLALFLTHYH